MPTQQPKKRPTAPAAPAWERPPRWSTWLLVVTSAAGIVLGGMSTWVHHKVKSGGYTSFCNLNESINCDTVVTSPYATLLHVPVSVWGMAFYAVLIVLALRTLRPDRGESERARADALAWAVAGTLFSAYLAVISLTVLKTLCLLCAGLYTVSVLALVAAWVQASPLREAASRLHDRWQAARSRPGLATAFVGVVIAVVGMASWLGAQTRLTKEQVLRSNPQFFDWYTSQQIINDPIPGGHSRGPENAPIQLVEFSDFECPHCAQAFVTLKDLLPRYKDQVRFTSHHFPLSNDCNESMTQKGHEHACKAAIAAECAAEGGKYEPYSTLLFANQGSLDDKSLAGYAKQVGLDASAFEKCLSSTTPTERITDDVKAAVKAGVRSTPTFFINGRRIEGNMPYENWLMAFAMELDKG